MLGVRFVVDIKVDKASPVFGFEVEVLVEVRSEELTQLPRDRVVAHLLGEPIIVDRCGVLSKPVCYFPHPLVVGERPRIVRTERSTVHQNGQIVLAVTTS